MNTEFQPSVEQQMLIRVPATRAFAAFTDPSVATKFWFSHSDGPLVEGSTVTWEWKPYRHSVTVHVVSIEPDKRIVIRWGDNIKHSKVEWIFAPHGNAATLVTVRNSDFAGFSADELVPVAIDSMGGFSLVLANAKAYLEHGIQLNLIFDKAPDMARDAVGSDEE